MILQSVKMALKAISSNKMRTFLTMLGVIIGVVALVVLVSLVNGATGSITDSINSLGTNMMSVTISDDHDDPIRLSSLSDVTDACDLIDEIAPTAQSSLTATSDYTEETVSVTGTTNAYANIMGLNLLYGRFIMQPDVDNNSNVIVINEGMATDVIGRTDVVGETIKIGGKSFSIIGVLEDDDSSLTSSLSGSYSAYIPYTALIRLTQGVGLDITSFSVTVNGDDMDAAQTQLENFLLNRFENDEDAYMITNMSSIQEAMSSVTNVLALLLGGIAGISLLVGGIGIMNIMLVSVTERTREIGIRKAIGASRTTIMLQFLVEALMVSVLGCMIGIVVSWIVIQIVNAVGSVSYSLDSGIVTIAIAFSVGIGVLFGIYPANKAAKKKPIDALRFN